MSSTRSKMAASRRLMKEIEEIRKCGMKNFRNIQVDEANLLTWQGLIVPVSIEHFHFLLDNSFRWCAATAGHISVFLSKFLVWADHRWAEVGSGYRVISRVAYGLVLLSKILALHWGFKIVDL